MSPNSVSTTATIDSAQLRRVLGAAPTSVIAVAGLDGEEPVGMIVGSFVGISLEPPIAGVCIQLSSSTWPRLRELPRLGLSVLSDVNRAQVRQLAGPASQRFAGVSWEERSGAVLIDGACAQLTATVAEEQIIGDHYFAVLSLDSVALPAAPEQESELRPLVFHASELKVPITN